MPNVISWLLLRLQQLGDLHSDTRTKKPTEISRKEQLLKWLKSEKIILLRKKDWVKDNSARIYKKGVDRKKRKKIERGCISNVEL
jgi:hypothetical protein